MNIVHLSLSRLSCCSAYETAIAFLTTLVFVLSRSATKLIERKEHRASASYKAQIRLCVSCAYS